MKGNTAMMTQMRENMPLIMWILVGAFLATIVFSWGMGGFKTKGQLDGVVGKVGDHEILYDQYNRLVQDRIGQLREKNKTAQISDALVKQARKEVWDDMVRNELLSIYQAKWGFVTSDEEVAFAVRNSPPQWIRDNDNFKKDGKFDGSRWEEFLRDPRSAEVLVAIEKDYRTSLGNQKVVDRIISPVFVSPTETWDEFEATNKKYKAAIVSFPIRNYPVDSASITNEEIQAYFTKNKANYERPERRRLAYAAFPVVATKDDTTHIIELATEALTRAQAGEDFAALATEYSEDEGTAKQGGDLGYFKPGQMVKEFDSTAFASDTGKVAGPVFTRFGVHIIKVVDHRKGAETDSVRASHILIKWKVGTETDERISQKAKDFSDAAKTEGMTKSAQRFGTAVKETDWIIKNQTGNIPGIGTIAPALDFAFGSKRGALSHVFKTKIRNEDNYIIFQVLDISPKGVAPLSEAESNIRSTLVRKKQQEKALEAAKQFRSRLRDQQSFFAEAMRESLRVDTMPDYGRRDFTRAFGSDEQLAKSILAIDPGQVTDALSNSRGAFVATLISKNEADPNAYQSQQKDLADRLRRNKQNAVYSDWLNTAEKTTGVQDNRFLYYTDY
jgi:peptidyl-prolyl cis-trans isomerase D